MALTNKQIKKKLRQLARQDAPIRCGDLCEAGPYQFSSPQPPQPQRKWVSRIAVCAACVAVAVSAVLLASPILRLPLLMKAACPRQPNLRRSIPLSLLLGWKA